MKIKIAIITVNYNSSSYTVKCVESLLKYAPKEYEQEIIIIDNNSSRSDFDALVESCGQIQCVKIIRSVINLGFSGGNMLGVQFADADYYWFLNNDCELLNDNARRFVEFFESRPDAALATGRMFESNGEPHNSFGHLPSVLGVWLGKGALEFLNREKYPKIKPDYESPIKVGMVTGASMFVRAKYFDEIGGFDTNHFLFCEEEDLAERFAKAGFSVYYHPEPRFVHHAGKSSERSYEIEREFFISFKYYLRKHKNFAARFLIKSFYFLKNLKRTPRGIKYLKLAFFILCGGGAEKSLKMKQKISRNLNQ